jgi:hypothetical protein
MDRCILSFISFLPASIFLHRGNIYFSILRPKIHSLAYFLNLSSAVFGSAQLFLDLLLIKTYINKYILYNLIITKKRYVFMIYNSKNFIFTKFANHISQDDWDEKSSAKTFGATHNNCLKNSIYLL